MSAVPLPTISVGQLRQNPTAMLRDVAEGREYVITNHGVPAAKVVPITRRSWVPAETLRPLFDTPVDPDFWPDIQAARQTGEPSDPYLKWDDQEPSR